MEVRIIIETTFDNGRNAHTHQLEGISRPYRVTCPDGIGLRLDGKRIVEQIKRVILYDQVDAIIRESRACPDCATVHAIHDYHTCDLGTLVNGRVKVSYAAEKRIKGRKRHIATDTLGLLVGLVVHSAGI